MNAEPSLKDYVEDRPKLTVSEVHGRYGADDSATVLPRLGQSQLEHALVDDPACRHVSGCGFNEKRIFVPANRYRVIFLRLLVEIRRNAFGEIKFPPGYLLYCIQKHMDFNADSYNAEGKKARDVVAARCKRWQRRPGAKRTVNWCGPWVKPTG
jgi:hypothetical protein